MLKFRAIMISLIIGIKFQSSDFEPKLIFKLGSSQKKTVIIWKKIFWVIIYHVKLQLSK